MAIKEGLLENDQLGTGRFGERITYYNGEDVSLPALQQALSEACERNGVPIQFRQDTLITGGLFNKQHEDIVIFTNPQHARDYMHFCMRLTRQGTYAYLDIYVIEASVNMAKADAMNSGGLMGNIIGGISGVKKKVQDEENYYQALSACMSQAFSPS